MQTKTIDLLNNDHNNSATFNRQIYMKNIQRNQFIDPQFKHSYDKIYSRQVQIQRSNHVIWTPCEELHHHPYYSYNDFTLEQLKNFNFITKKINIALIIMKFLEQKTFYKLTKQRQLYLQYQNQKIKHFFTFNVMANKQMRQIVIDSYVPVSEIRNRQVFAQNTKGCIFPCLIEKMFAKICGGYFKIKDLDLTQIMEILTGYVRQQIVLKQWKSPNNNEDGNNNKNRVDIKRIQQYIDQKINAQKSIIFFKTRKNSQLISYGLRPNSIYCIVGLSKSKQNDKIITFLQYTDDKQKQRQHHHQQQQQLNESINNELGWIGKHSKYRFNNIDVNSNKNTQLINANKQLINELNYMSVQDMIEVSQSLIVLHNISQYHQSTNNNNNRHFEYTFTQGLKLPLKVHEININNNKLLIKDNHNNNINKVLQQQAFRQNKQNFPPIKKQLYSYQQLITLKYNNRKNVQTTNKINHHYSNKLLINFNFIIQNIQQKSNLYLTHYAKHNNIQNLTILIWNNLNKSIVYSKTNTKPKLSKYIRQKISYNHLVQLYANQIIENSNSLSQQNQIQLTCLVYLDCWMIGSKNSQEEEQKFKIELHINKWQLQLTNNNNYNNQNDIKKQNLSIIKQYQRLNNIYSQPYNRNKIQQNPIFNIIKSLISTKNNLNNNNINNLNHNNSLLEQSNNNHNHNHIFTPSSSHIEIICNQLIDQLSVGVVWIRLSNFQSKMKQQSLVVHQDMFRKIKLDINHQLLIKEGVYLWHVKGNVDKRQYINSKQNNINNNNNIINSIQSWRVTLNYKNPQLIIIFKILITNNKQNNDNNKRITFPPYQSIKITKVVNIIH